MDCSLLMHSVVFQENTRVSGRRASDMDTEFAPRRPSDWPRITAARTSTPPSVHCGVVRTEMRPRWWRRRRRFAVDSFWRPSPISCRSGATVWRTRRAKRDFWWCVSKLLWWHYYPNCFILINRTSRCASSAARVIWKSGVPLHPAA